MRLAGKQKLGCFPLPLAEAERIRRFLQFPLSGYAVLDPCIGDGSAFKVIAGNPQAIRYGIELDACRVEQAREVGHPVIDGDALDVHCPVESLSLLYLNPPYDFECGQSQNRRLEQILFEHCYRWLKPAGVLVLVVPGDRLAVCGRLLAFHFKDKMLTGWAHRRVRSTSRSCCSVPGVRAVNAISCLMPISSRREI